MAAGKSKPGPKPGAKAAARRAERERRRAFDQEDSILRRLKEMQDRQEDLAKTVRTQLNVIVRYMVLVKKLLEEDQEKMKVDYDVKSPYIK